MDASTARSKAAYLILAFSFLIAAVIAVYAVQNPVERTIQNLRDAVNNRPASGNIHVVEIDAKSLQEFKLWPWPRGYHARLVDRLNAAGADQITFDVDFSSHSNPAQDAAFAAAIERASGKVVLPTFRQSASSKGSSAEIESLPIEILRNHAFLGAVNVHPDKDGRSTAILMVPLQMARHAHPSPHCWPIATAPSAANLPLINRSIWIAFPGIATPISSPENLPKML